MKLWRQTGHRTWRYLIWSSENLRNMLHCDACCTHPQVCKYCIDSTDSFLKVFLLLNVIMWTYPLGNPMLVELVGGMALWPELGENVPDNFQSTTLLSEKMLTSNIHLGLLLDSCSLFFPKVFEGLQRSHSFCLFNVKLMTIENEIGQGTHIFMDACLSKCSRELLYYRWQDPSSCPMQHTARLVV